jgi:tRNA-specific 2-thiouridylase
MNDATGQTQFPPPGARVAVGLSGGVDSAMSALLLRDRGCDVGGVMMTVRDESGRGCAAGEDVGAARDLAGRIGVPLEVVDCSGPYRELILDNFRDEYLAGKTPNPCIRCNPLIKFGAFPDLLRKRGVMFDFFATGHYARIEFREELGRHALLRGVDTAKDQSYFLYRLPVGRLATIVFPLGGFRKAEIRDLARRRGLPVHDKPDSQDFYAGDYGDLLDREAEDGDIVDTSGNVLGRHRGYWKFTPGQRKGLGVAHSEPLYVIRVEPARNRVVVGTRDEELRRGCRAGDLRFHGPVPRPGTVLSGKLRSMQPLREMTVCEADDGILEVRFSQPQQGVAPGQSLVLYDGDVVVGGGVITEAT